MPGMEYDFHPRLKVQAYVFKDMSLIENLKFTNMKIASSGLSIGERLSMSEEPPFVEEAATSTQP